MKIVKVTLLSGLVFFVLVSCFAGRNEVNSDNNVLSLGVESKPNDSCRLVVSFISIGAGTDAKAYIKFGKYLSDYEYYNKVNLSVDTIYWGREGEVDFAFGLKEITPSQQEGFIRNMKTCLKESTLIRYKEFALCNRKKSK